MEIQKTVTALEEIQTTLSKAYPYPIPIQIFNMDTDKFGPPNPYSNHREDPKLVYRFVHEPNNDMIVVLDDTGAPSKGAGLDIILTLEHGKRWKYEVTNWGSGYAKTDKVQIYGNVTGQNVLIAYLMAMDVNLTYPHDAKVRESARLNMADKMSGMHCWWGGTIRQLKDDDASVRCHASRGPGYTEYITRLAIPDRHYRECGFHRAFVSSGIRATINGSDTFRKLYLDEIRRGAVFYSVRSGIKVLSRVLGHVKAQDFQEKWTSLSYGKYRGPLDDILRSLQIQSLNQLGNVRDATDRRTGIYLQDPIPFGSVTFKRFRGAVNDAASFATYVRPLIPDEHAAAVSAHLAQLPIGSIVRPRYIKDFISKRWGI